MWVDGQGLVVVHLRELVPLLAVVGESDPIPGVVVSPVGSHGTPEALQGLVKLFNGHVLVTKQSVSVRKTGVDLKYAQSQLLNRSKTSR